MYKVVIISAIEQSGSDSFPTQIITEFWVEFSVLSSRSPLTSRLLEVHGKSLSCQYGIIVIF